MATHLFIDNSFFFVEGYKHVKSTFNIPDNKKTTMNYNKVRQFFDEKYDDIKRRVIAGSNLPGNLIATLQRNSFEVFTQPKFFDRASGKNKERGVDHKLIWEIAKTLFTGHDSERMRIVLCSGDRDFQPIFPDIMTCSCDLDVYVWKNAYSKQYKEIIQSFGKVFELNDEWRRFIDIV